MRLLRDADAGAADELDFAARARDVSRSLGKDRSIARLQLPSTTSSTRAAGSTRSPRSAVGCTGSTRGEARRYPHEQTRRRPLASTAALAQLRAGGLGAPPVARTRRPQLALRRSGTRGVPDRARAPRPWRSARLLGGARGTPTSARISGTSSHRSAAERGAPVPKAAGSRKPPRRLADLAARARATPRAHGRGRRREVFPLPLPVHDLPRERRICLR